MSNVSLNPVDFLEELVRAYSPSRNEERVAQLLLNALKELGFEGVHSDSAGNVSGSRGEAKHGGPELLLFSHMDTVPGRLPVKRTSGEIFGRGAVDAKASLAALLFAAADAEFDGKITFAGVVEEELPNGRGTPALLRSCHPVLAINGEPSNASGVNLAYKGRVAITGEALGTASHASCCGSEGAVDRVFSFYKSIQALHPAENAFDSLSANLTYLSGGDANAINVTPATIKFAMDIRFPPSLQLPVLLEEIQRVAGSHAACPLIRFQVVDEVPPAALSENHSLVRAFVSGIRSEGMQPRFLRKLGTSDMNACIAAGIPTISYGPGDPKLAHTENECVAIADYLKSIGVLKKTIEKLSSANA